MDFLDNFLRQYIWAYAKDPKLKEIDVKALVDMMGFQNVFVMLCRGLQLASALSEQGGDDLTERFAIPLKKLASENFESYYLLDLSNLSLNEEEITSLEKKLRASAEQQKTANKVELVCRGIFALGVFFTIWKGCFGNGLGSRMVLSGQDPSIYQQATDKVLGLANECKGRLNFDGTPISSLLVAKCLEDELQIGGESDQQESFDQPEVRLTNNLIFKRSAEYYLDASRQGNVEASEKAKVYLRDLYFRSSFGTDSVKHELQDVIRRELKASTREKVSPAIDFIFGLYKDTVRANSGLASESASIDATYQASLRAILQEYPVKDELKDAHAFLFDWYKDPNYAHFACSTQDFEKTVPGINIRLLA